MFLKAFQTFSLKMRKSFIKAHLILNIFCRRCTPGFHPLALLSADRATHVCLLLASDGSKVDGIDEWAGEHLFCWNEKMISIKLKSSFSSFFLTLKQNSMKYFYKSQVINTHVALIDLVSLLRSCELDLIIFIYLFLNSTPACSSWWAWWWVKVKYFHKQKFSLGK